MSQALSGTATTVPNDGPHDQESRERRFLAVRTILDMLLVCGGVVVVIAMVVPVSNMFPLDSYSLSYLWAVVALICSALIVGLTCKYVSRSTRAFTSALLALVLLSFASLNFLLFWVAPEFLTQFFQLQIVICAFVAWAIVCLGLICVESRIEHRLSQPSNSVVNFSVKAMCFRAMILPMLGVAMIVLLVFPVITAPVYFEQTASAWWPVAEATLIEPEEHSRKWLNYSYNVGGNAYVGTREVTFLDSASELSVHGNSEHRLSELKLQEKFPVAYNPNHPERSLIEPGASGLMLLSIWGGCLYILMIPTKLRVLTNAYKGESLSKLEATKFESVTAMMALVGVVLGFAWWGLACWMPWRFDWASLLLIIGIGAVYRISKKTAKKFEADVDRTEPTG